MKVLSFLKIFGFIGIACFAAQGSAASVSRADITTWLNQVVTMDPPAAGTVVTDTNLDLVRPFMPPGYVDEFSYSGNYSIDFNGDYLSSGVYFVELKSGSLVEYSKIILLK